jgi:hypothetical protein
MLGTETPSLETNIGQEIEPPLETLLQPVVLKYPNCKILSSTAKTFVLKTFM